MVNKLANDIVREDSKIEFLIAFLNWLENWSQSASCLTLSKQTFNPLIQTLQNQAQLCKDLFEEDYEFIIPARFQTNPLEKQFS